MAVSNGEYANEQTFNDSFMSRDGNTDTVGKVDLVNVQAESGVSILNLQKNINALYSILGITPNQVKDYTSVITAPDFMTSEPGLGDRLIGKTLALANSTGVLDGLDLSINLGDPSKFDIAPGKYEVADFTDPENPIMTPVEYAGSTANSVTNLAIQEVTYISLDSSGAIFESSLFPTPQGRRERAFIGRLNHNNNVDISFADTFPDFKLSIIANFYDLIDALAPFKMDSGLLCTPNGANLSFDRNAGSVFFRSSNYTTNKFDPHTASFAQQTLQPFRKMTQALTADISDVTVIDPTNYDLAGVVTPLPGGPQQATIQRVYMFKSGAVRVAYGQTLYNNITFALSSLPTELFTINPTVPQTAVLIGFIVVRNGATDLSNTSDALIVPASRFGTGVGGGGGGGGGGSVEVSAEQVLNNTDTITLLAVPLQRVLVKMVGSNDNNAVLLPDGTIDAQRVYVVCTAADETFIIANGGNVLQNGNIEFRLGKVVEYQWVTAMTKWLKLGE
jgi:hypothetical protein